MSPFLRRTEFSSQNTLPHLNLTLLYSRDWYRTCPKHPRVVFVPLSRVESLFSFLKYLLRRKSIHLLLSLRNYNASSLFSVFPLTSLTYRTFHFSVLIYHSIFDPFSRRLPASSVTFLSGPPVCSILFLGKFFSVCNDGPISDNKRWRFTRDPYLSIKMGSSRMGFGSG